MRKIFYTAALSAAILMGGCSGGHSETEGTGRTITLGVGELESTRAAVDAWNNTQVSIAYVFAPGTAFDKSLTVPVAGNSGASINTGLVYPTGGTAVSFIGYHPVAAPSAASTVTYDLKGGNTDVMMSNRVSGTLASPIAQKLDFKHLLTRVTFRMNVAAGRQYTDQVYGVRAQNSTGKALMSAVTLDLKTGTESFHLPGTVFCGGTQGYDMPKSGEAPLIFDMMVQPDVPLEFSVVGPLGYKTIKLKSDPSGLWADLTANTGGGKGLHYTVNLSFAEEVVYSGQITIVPWKQGLANPDDDGTVVWE